MAWDSERRVVGVDEELELVVMAQALALATLVVVAADLSEILCVEGEGEVVEELNEMSGALAAVEGILEEMGVANGVPWVCSGPASDAEHTKPGRV